jgi:hypothetical protein
MATNDKTKIQRNGNVGAAKAHQAASRRRNRGNGEQPDWSVANPVLVLRLITAIAKIDGAVQFGYTRAKDQYVIRVVGDGEPFNEYLRPTEDLDYWLEGFVQDYELDGTSPAK